MRVVIVSRIFTPEPAAASFLLHAVAEAFAAHGHEVEVFTTTFPPGLAERPIEGVRVRRAPVRRDNQGYVRGYASYLSFDVPLLFRLIFSRRADLYFVEPPPTTGAVVRVISALRRAPYVYDAADLWSDAAGLVTSSALVLGALRAVERFALRGAAHAFAISQGLIDRMRQLGVETAASPVGFGTDTNAFRYVPQTPPTSPVFVYGGSYSEWHGAEVFVEAFAAVRARHPDARLLFVGNGSEKPRLLTILEEQGLDGVEFHEPVAPEVLSDILSGATASLASLRPGGGYDYAFTTKVYASLVAGCPVVFAGVGPTGPFLSGHGERHEVGVALEWDVDAVTAAMLAAAAAPLQLERRVELAAWASGRFSMSSVAESIVAESERLVAHR